MVECSFTNWVVVGSNTSIWYLENLLNLTNALKCLSGWIGLSLIWIYYHLRLFTFNLVPLLEITIRDPLALKTPSRICMKKTGPIFSHATLSEFCRCMLRGCYSGKFVTVPLGLHEKWKDHVFYVVTL